MAYERIEVRTQAEMDAAAARQKLDVTISIVVVGTASVMVWGSSRVVAWGSSRVVAWESSRVVAWESSSVEAWGSSRVVARESSRVVARESSSVEAWGSSRVVAWESSRVVAWESSRVVAWGAAQIRAFGSAVVVAASVMVAVSIHSDDVKVTGGTVIKIEEPATAAAQDAWDGGAVRDDLFAVLDAAPAEVQALLAAVRAGKINGSVYRGECACLVGTIANARGCDVDSVGIALNSRRPAERWFMDISVGDTPASSVAAKIAETWISAWLAAHPTPAVETPAAAPVSP